MGLDVAGVVSRVRDDPLEVRVSREIFYRGAGDGVSEKGLGEEDDEG